MADSPHLLFEMLDSFERAGLTRVIGKYLGERPTISVQKCTLRKVDPDAGHGWHQDGAFMGDVRALNVWLSLSRCGDEAPGMDVVPRRLDHIVPTGTEGAIFEWSVSPQVAEEAAGEVGAAADLRTGRRAALRRPLPALDGRRALDEEESHGDRELVLRSLRLTLAVLAACRLSARDREGRDVQNADVGESAGGEGGLSASSSVHMQKTGGFALQAPAAPFRGASGLPGAADGDPADVAPQSSSSRALPSCRPRMRSEDPG